MMQAFRADPDANPLATPSGKIEIWSQTIADFGYDDCLGHPAWLEPMEWLGNAGDYPLHMISNQPSNKLHSQLDHGTVSQSTRVAGREPVTMHPTDASARNLTEGQIVRIFNGRGACLAGLHISDEIRPGVIKLSPFRPMTGRRNRRRPGDARSSLTGPCCPPPPGTMPGAITKAAP